MEAREALPNIIALEVPFQPGSLRFCDLASVLKSEACIEGLNLVHINFLFNSISFQGHKPYPGDQDCSLTRWNDRAGDVAEVINWK